LALFCPVGIEFCIIISVYEVTISDLDIRLVNFYTQLALSKTLLSTLKHIVTTSY
jgi:hypothetical protein